MVDPFKKLESDLTSMFLTAAQSAEIRKQPPGAGENNEGIEEAQPTRKRRRGKRRRGAPLGNQNARTHGLYAKALTREQLELLPLARKAYCLYEEVAVWRLKVLDILADRKADPEFQLRAMRVLVQLARTDDRMRFGP